MMTVITINIPEPYLQSLEVLQEKGMYISRSEAIREALKRFLTREFEIIEKLKPEIFSKLKDKQLERFIR